MRFRSHSFTNGTVTLLVSALLSTHAVAASKNTVVNVQLQDPSGDPSSQAMRVIVDRDSAPAGKITFRAVNRSKSEVHEVLVVGTKEGQTDLPYDEKEREVIEKRIDRRGEIDNIKPGKSGTMTLNLKPGSYLLLCNQPGHYKAGMSVPFTVTK